MRIFKAYESSNGQFNKGSTIYGYLSEIGMTDFQFGISTNFTQFQVDSTLEDSVSSTPSIHYKYRNPKSRTSVILNEIVAHKKEDRYQPNGKIYISIVFEKPVEFEKLEGCDLNHLSYAKLLMQNDTSMVYKLETSR